MEELVHGLKSSSKVLLLYGESGVGKSFLLRELCRSQLGDKNYYWIDLDPGAAPADGELDKSRAVVNAFATANEGDVIVVDHFEKGLKNDRQQLLMAWSKLGANKGICMVIVSDGKGFGELRKLSQQYKVEMKRFQQMPFNTDDVSAFLSFYLFAEQPIGKLSIASPARKRLSATAGVAARVIEAAEHDRELINSTPLAISQSNMPSKRFVSSALALMVIAFAGVWYLNLEQSALDSPSLASVKAEPVTNVEPTQISSESEVTTALVEPAIVTASADDIQTPAKMPELEIDEDELLLSEIEGAADSDDSLVEPDFGSEDSAPDPWFTDDELAADSTLAETGDDTDDLFAISENQQNGRTAEIIDSDYVDQQDVSLLSDPFEPGSDWEEPLTDEDDPILDQVANPAAIPEVDKSTTAIDEIATTTVTADEPEIPASDPVDTRKTTDTGKQRQTAATKPPPKKATARKKARVAARNSPPKNNKERFARDLQRSLEWVNKHPRPVGTMQILLLKANTFDADSYYDYINKLAARKVNVEWVRVLKTFTAGSEGYSVVYGEFRTRKIAIKLKNKLPQAIRETSPIARSIGGLRDEIKRLKNRG